MRHYTDGYVFCSALAPVLSLDQLLNPQSDSVDFGRFDYPDPSLTSDEQLECAEAVRAVDKFVSSLTPRERDMLYRAFWGGETQTAIAAHFGVSKMAISKSLRKILERARRVLAPYGYLASLN